MKKVNLSGPRMPPARGIRVDGVMDRLQSRRLILCVWGYLSVNLLIVHLDEEGKASYNAYSKVAVKAFPTAEWKVHVG